MRVLEDFVLTYAVNSLWQVPLVAGCGWVVARLLARLGAKAQYRVWTISLVAALWMPAAGMSFVWTGFHPGTSSQVMLSADGNAQTLPLLPSYGSIALPRSIAAGLLVLYGLLVLASFSRFLFGVLRTHRFVREAQPAMLSTEEAAVWEFCRREFAVESTRIRVHSSLAGPVACGWKRPMLIVPQGFLAACERDDLLAAFAHEAAHIERHDFFWNSFFILITLPLAYHPLIFFMQAKVAESRELICDDLASTRLLNAERYATSLFRLASRISRNAAAASIHAIGIFDANVLEKRMKKLTQKTALVGSRAKLALVTGSIVLAGCVVVAASAMSIGVTHAAAAESQANVSAQEQVFHVGNGVTAPSLTYSVDPEFPDKNDKPFGFKGTCVVNAVVGKDGRVKEVRVVRSLEPAFDHNATDTVRQYRFKPGLKDGRPVMVSVQIEVNFRKY